MHQILAQSRKKITKFFVFIDFHLYYTEPDSSHGGLFEGGSLFVRKQLKGGAYSMGGVFNGGGLIKSLWYYEMRT